MTSVNIYMHTIQYDKQGDKDIIEVKSVGDMYEKNGDTYIVYKEELEKGAEHVTTTIKISDKEVLIKRFGVVNSNMKFILNNETITKYRTPQGIFDIKINTTKLDIINSKDTVKICIDYNMKIIGLFEGVNKIKIEVKQNN